MNEMLQSVKTDLLSRRLLPVLVLLCVGLVAAVAYVALGGEEQPKPAAPVAATPLPSGLPLTVAPPSATAAASETPAGSRYQSHDPSRNPFLPLPGAVATGNAAGGASSAATTSAGSSSASNSATGANGGSSGSSGGSGGGSTPPKPPVEKASPKKTSPERASPKKRSGFRPRPDLLFKVSVLFGSAPASPEQQPALTPFEELRLYEPLPFAKTPLLVYLGVTKGGEKAAFALVVPPILRGPAVCLPSESQCQAIALAAGQSEELEYVKTDGEAVAFELKVVKVARRSNASGASASARKISKAGRLALSRAGLLALR